jgi:hypothetical protein
MPRHMIARFPGVCRECSGRINRGDAIVFRGKGNSVHLLCSEPGNSSDPTDAASPASPPAIPATVPSSEFQPTGNVLDGTRWLVDWPQLREAIVEAMAGDFGRFPNAPSVAREIASVQKTTFTGYSRTQALDWLENGYTDEALAGLEDFAPPIREKRRFVYGEEGDEIDLSAAWAGEDNFMTHWTKRDVIPGIALEFRFGFQAATPAHVVNGYQHWIARATEAIQSAGIDPEISIVFGSKSTWDQVYREEVVRVKKQNETVDLHSWSSMLSPAVYRTFGFLAKCLHAENRGKTISKSIGKPHSRSEWKVYYDEEAGKIITENPWEAPSFDEDRMTAQLREAIEQLKRGQS